MKKNENLGCILPILTLIFGLFCFIVLTIWTDRTLDFWCTYISGHTINVPIWLSALCSFIGNGVVLVINIISEIIRLCL